MSLAPRFIPRARSLEKSPRSRPHRAGAVSIGALHGSWPSCEAGPEVDRRRPVPARRDQPALKRSSTNTSSVRQRRGRGVTRLEAAPQLRSASMRPLRNVVALRNERARSSPARNCWKSRASAPRLRGRRRLPCASATPPIHSTPAPSTAESRCGGADGADLGVTLTDPIRDPACRKNSKLEAYVTDKIGPATLNTSWPSWPSRPRPRHKFEFSFGRRGCTS